mmetsp:Transcript_10502/g.10071  ORF Transcript_10502/g.10071 Transcript_10502/m.10071 type:complete len:97 (+) Transcript_10502:90-380(+)
MNNNGLGNRQVMEFASFFLEQSSLRSLFAASIVESSGQPERPTISVLCKIITPVSKAATATVPHWVCHFSLLQMGMVLMLETNNYKQNVSMQQLVV